MARRNAPHPAKDVRHSVVHRDQNAFCGWPFYCGLWRTAGGTLVAGFKRIPVNYGQEDAVSHERLIVGQGELVLTRSSDEGESWERGVSHVHRLDITAAEIDALGPRNYAPEGPLDLTHPDTLFMSGATPAFLKPDSQPWLRASSDGGLTWRRHILLPMHGLPALSGCGSVLIRSDGLALLGLAMTTEGGWMNRPLVFASPDGIDWRFLTFVAGQDPFGQSVSVRDGQVTFGAKGLYYPRMVELADGRILCSLRCQRDARSVLWTEIYASEDGGLTWSFLSRVNEWGAPGDLVAMKDGRVACIYGYRVAPFGIRARISEDRGATWGREIVLRDDGGSWDLGYPRAIELKPGVLMAHYYMNLASDPVQRNGGIRHIAQTVFRPD